ncbi:hypothetical protein EHM69_05245 [candidate division KSB1 bacterium]|nr:MAG: hypothetical protein EHM69_05245 [candidate division KSB1 bacterium]
MNKSLLILTIIAMCVSSLFAEPKSWKQTAQDAIMSGDYQTAVTYYKKWTEADPGDAVSLYNLACCYSILKQPDSAMVVLRKAAAAGWSDAGHTAEDPDLESLRSLADFKTVLEDIARNSRMRHGGYTSHLCMQQRVGEYLVVLPDEYDPAKRYPLVILLHGYGQAPEKAAEWIPLISTREYIYAIPQGPYIARDSEGKGFSHLRERDDYSEDASGAPVTADWIVRTADDVMKRYPVADSTFRLIGFSQGGAMAHVTAAYYPSRVKGYCAHGGYIIKNAITPAQLVAEKTAGVKVLITHGKEDPAVGLEEAAYASNMLKQAGLDVTFYMVEGAHKFTAETGLKISEWLKEKMGK